MKRLFLILCFALFCGVVFSGNAFAINVEYEGIPSIPVADVYPNGYVLYKDTAGDIRAFVVIINDDSPEEPYFKFTTDEEMTRISFSSNNKGLYTNYVLRDVPSVGLQWNQVDNTSYTFNAGTSKLMNSAVFEFLKTSNEITLSDGTVVFPEPPTPTLTQVIQEETTRAQGTILKAMTVIALCGVGCLALLTVLPILSRVFSRYR